MVEHPAYNIPVSFLDVAKLGPEGAKLEKLGQLLGLPKIQLPPGYSIERMDELLAGDREAFVAYAIRDAEIAVKYSIEVLKFSRANIWAADDNGDAGELETNELGKSRRKISPISAGALGVQLCRKTIRESGLDCNEVFGLEKNTRSDWNSQNQRLNRFATLELCPTLSFRQNQVVACFHGGRNETFYAGPTPISWVHDFDLVGAYTTAMVLFRQIDFATSYETRDVSQFLNGGVGFAMLDFEYPASVRYPGLPVRSEERGLLFPLRGVSYATAPEIELAISQGADIKIRHGLIFPWKDPNGTRVFLRFVQEIRRLRAMYPKKSLFEQTAKLLGNSVYGKTAQGLKGKNAFDTRSMGSQPVPFSSVTNAPIAAMTTGFIRAVVGEMLHRLPAHRTAYSVTTDGILTDASPEEIDLDGPLCQRYLELCEMVEA